MPVSPIWPAGSAVNDEGEITFHGRTAASLLDEFGSPLYVIDTDDVRARATKFVHAASHAFNNTVTHVSFAGKALLSKEICRIVTESGMLIDTCTMGEMRIALAVGVPGRRLVLHGNNKSDAEIELAIEQGFNKIVIDEPDEPARIAAIAKRLAPASCCASPPASTPAATNSCPPRTRTRSSAWPCSPPEPTRASLLCSTT